MPRASYGDRHSISVVHGSQQTAFDFTSRVIDFFIIFSSEPTAGMCWKGITGVAVENSMWKSAWCS